MTSVHARNENSLQVGAPELCRVTVLARHTEVDLALPLGVPVALLLPGLVDLVAGHSRDNDFDETPERTRPDAWTLARIGRAPLSGAMSLDEHGIRDGELLVLEDIGSPAPPPLFDDVVYSVAESGHESVRPWGAVPAALLASALGPVALVAGCAALLNLPSGAGRFAAGTVCGVLSLLLVIATVVLARLRDRRTATALALCALPPAFTGGVLLVPGEPAAPHVLLGSVLTGALAVIVLRAAGIGLATFTAVATVSTGVVAGTTLVSATGIGLQALGAGAVVTALLLAGAAPRLAAMLARLPIPPVPAPGTGAGTAEPEDTATLPSLEDLERRAAQARSFLTGLLYAVVVLATGGAWSGVLPVDGRMSWPGIVLAVATAAVLMFRGRTYTAAEQVIPLVAGGALLLVGLLAGAAVTASPAPWFVFAVAVVLACGGFVFGIVAPRRTFTPVQRRIAELVEYATIAAVVPAACWVAGVYSAVRGL